MPPSESRCPLCQSASTVTLFEKHGTPYRRCGGCHFRFATPAVDPNISNGLEQFERAYLQYLGADHASSGNFDALCAWIRRFHMLDGARLLDIGAGGGTFVRYLRDRGVLAEGLEPSAPLYSHFLAGDPAFTEGNLTRFLAARSDRFDIVTAFDVIEHVANPISFLRDAAAMLAHDGVLCLSMPDVDSPVARLAGRRWHHYNAYHLSFFSRKTLKRAAASAGLTISHFTHRGRRRPVGYMLRYACEFVFGARAPRWAASLDSLYVHVNLFDTAYACLRRTAAHGAA